MNNNLNDNTILYRFVNFYECYDILKNKKFRFQKLSCMADKNEGLGYMLYMQQDYLSRIRVATNDKIESELRKYQNNIFISSWTKESDLIALWSLYSPDCSSVRIETTVKKLREIAQNYLNSNHWNQGLDLDPGDPRLVCHTTGVDEVSYIDFYATSQRIKSHWEKMYSELEEPWGNNRQEAYDNKHIFDKYRDNCKHLDYSHNWRLKDISYKYENEVRINIDVGIRDKYPIHSQERNAALYGVLDYAPEGHFPDSIYLDVNDDFIERICIDPRCPEFKTKTIIDVLSNFNIKISTSKAFGYALHLDEFSIKI